MLIRKCDRCGKQIENTENYWIMSIREKENGVVQQKEYCKDCIKKIGKVVNNVR